jgi:hypothetical protein
MATRIPPPAPLPDFQSLFDVSELTRALLVMQRSQLEALLAWQQSVTTVQQEFWDEWVCRWCGGAPIDA